MIRYEIYPSIFGELGIAASDTGLVGIDLQVGKRPLVVKADWQRGANHLTDAASDQLAAYFAGERQSFDLPLDAAGTPFQQSVWRALCAIPYGETRSYRELAEAIGNPKAVRAVARANGANPLSIVVPCHRVIGADGTLTGYAGGLEMKARLLVLEGALIG
ncbi:methylated-DNA--[protein]-cysteine S-methyltransferase [Microbulbifer sp. CAU 1566]|uniref:methylated-DNA--[protein]-cysteine S-methyltransferase n=1 Tax=Microbulbifer sp. CAU 1566 TaxID=2933269 RepID=UPI002003DA48|nr:methylated-DNA--[protein]-cysteine S-methyltransferase [Microbulbifer sp. CAU 1566]MCK7597752.1 methylated-DNA--[protein]-cysteine S-methyltransferase [Microbulbifer sp. CAU 1566]